ncbi:MAG: uroporphyrinogen decarboxylase, partial [Hyphomonadaceae bacterium]|nr:uroporphyrinogen decarboxylase [Hyphomonadaceae bacterium]
RELGVSVPVIGFPRGAGVQAASFAARTGVNAIGLDHGADPRAIVGLLPEGLPLQGNLDPELLTVGGSALENGVRDVLAAFAKAPHVFNLGHGITPQADPAHVARMVALVRGQV